MGERAAGSSYWKHRSVSGDAESVDAELIKFDRELGLVFGYAIICKVAGRPYFDSQSDHIPEDSMLQAATDFMLNSRVQGDMHQRDVDGVAKRDGTVVFAFPLTTDIAKAFGLETDRTGLMIAVKPSAEVLSKFESGEYTGFSIGGDYGTNEPVEI